MVQWNQANREPKTNGMLKQDSSKEIKIVNNNKEEQIFINPNPQPIEKAPSPEINTVRNAAPEVIESSKKSNRQMTDAEKA